MTVTAYGPRAAPERLAQIEAILAALALPIALHLADASAGEIVLCGTVADVLALCVGDAHDCGYGHELDATRRWCAVRIDRDVLAATLRMLGRTTDAEHVDDGPPDAPREGRAGEVLVVLELGDLVAVSWQPRLTRVPLALEVLW